MRRVAAAGSPIRLIGADLTRQTASDRVLQIMTLRHGHHTAQPIAHRGGLRICM